LERVLKAKLYQETAVYRNPLTAEIIETFPLPPPSTTLGLIHKLVNAQETIHALDVSIQGEHSAILRDYQHYKKFGTSHPYPIVVNVLQDLCLILHIKGRENFIYQLLEAFQNPPSYISLGRAEDLCLVKDVKIVTVEETKNITETQIPAYILQSEAESLELQGPLFRLPTYYHLEKVTVEKKDYLVRSFNWFDYRYIEEQELGGKNPTILVDEEGDVVWWCMPKALEKP
jgi:CRISPR-associated protein Cas5t